MTDPATSAIAENLRRVRARIAAAAAAAGRPADSVTLVAVSKTKPANAVAAALAAGQAVFGENRVQEAAEKFPALRAAHPELRLHLIGGLQTNKAREAVRLADVIETLDRPRLADALEAAMEKEGRRPELLIEVNTGDEPQKSGHPARRGRSLHRRQQGPLRRPVARADVRPAAGPGSAPAFHLARRVRPAA